MLKSIATYLFLIGIPLVGLLWILDYGERLSAPPAIAGDWQIEGALTECFAAQPSKLSIQQSGRFLRVAMGSASGEAQLDEHELRARIVMSEGPCDHLELDGVFDVAVERFVGRTTSVGCDACQDIYFVAQRAKQ